jgi:hypothetical protein
MLLLGVVDTPGVEPFAFAVSEDRCWIAVLGECPSDKSRPAHRIEAGQAVDRISMIGAG